MKPIVYILLTSIIFSIQCLGQTFQFREQEPRIVPENFFFNVEASSIDYSDIDNDGDLDIFNEGLYLNNGDGNFNKTLSIYNGSIAVADTDGAVRFSDVDGDGDEDILLVGFFYSTDGNARLYINDGSGYFTEMLNHNIQNVGKSSICFGDIDNDNDQDVIVTGSNEPLNNGTTRIYRNDGTGTFSLDTLQPFYSSTPYLYGQYSSNYGIEEGNAIFEDIDLDGDLDLMLSGNFTKLYLNDGSGIFTEDSTTIFDQSIYSSVQFADVNNDNYPDLFLTGDALTPIGTGVISKLYLNTNTGTFQELIGTTFQPVKNGNTDFGDIDNDGDLDLILTGNIGSYNSPIPSTNLYKNDGTGIFTETTDTILRSTFNSEVKFIDADNDSYLDVIIAGNGKSHIYKNQGNGSYSPFLEEEFIFPGNDVGVMKFSDLNGNGFQDVCFKSAWGETLIYFNDGNGGYDENSDTLLDFNGGVQSYQHQMDIADVDNDFDNDIFLDGTLFKNDGNGSFTQDITQSFNNCPHTILFGDIDTDEDQDLLICNEGVTEIYKNDGNGNFNIHIPELIYEGLTFSDAKFADFDNDGDLDLIISGQKGDWCYTPITHLYLNDGNGNYSLTSTNFDQVKNSSIDVADVDGDGDLDFILLGYTFQFTLNEGTNCKLYLNDGNANFTESLLNNLFEGSYGNVKFADLDNDDDPDLIISGFYLNIENQHTILYSNDGTGVFTPVPNQNQPFYDVYRGQIDCSDVDNDGDQDVFIMGSSEDEQFSDSISACARLFYNELIPSVGLNSINAIQADNTIYPNPTHGIVNITLNSNSNIHYMEVSNINGTVILNKKINGNDSYTVDLSNYANGIYIIALESSKERKVYKVIKE